MMTVRQALYDDLEAINLIYNQAVDTRCSTAETVHVDIDARIRWFVEHDPLKYPVLVAELGGRVVGWTSLSPYRKGRQGLSSTVEISYYVHADYRRRGVGSAMMRAVLGKAKEFGYRNVIAILFDTNEASIRLLEKNGFERWGLMPGIIDVDGKTYGHLYCGRRL